MAKLIWSLQNGQLPDWAATVGPSTLIIIDEAGMADTLSLDAAVRFALDRGASVRLIGDDQQLAAIGAGGVFATSNMFTAPCSSPSFTASRTRPKPKHPLRSATATGTP
jgi:ATP-dependent exoDNAse (exonuclease V) alpha subunit